MREVPRHLAVVAAMLPMVLWLAGVLPVDLARVCTGIVVLCLAFKFAPVEAHFQAARPVLLALIWATALAVTGHQVARLVAGSHGIDFAIFAQITQSISDSGRPITTLLGEKPLNFLTHHFAPVLYVPGLLAWGGIPAPIALILAYGASFAAALFALRRFAIEAGLSSATASGWVLTVALGQSIRPEILWGVHDEIFALPLLGWSLVMLQRKRWTYALVLSAATAVAKESFFVLPCFVLVLIVLEARRQTERHAPRRLAAWAAFAASWLVLGVAYVFGQPLWSDRAFDHLNKFEFTGYLDPVHVRARVEYLALLFVPVGALPLLTRAARTWILPALPFIGLSLLSSDAEMFRPAGYHAAIPAYVLGFAGAVALEEVSRTASWFSPEKAVALLLPLQLAFGATSLWIPLKQAAEKQWYPARGLAASLPPNTRIAADPAGVIALLGSGLSVTRLWGAEGLQRPPDVLVQKPGGWEEVHPTLAAQYRPCGSLDWRVLCLTSSSLELK